MAAKRLELTVGGVVFWRIERARGDVPRAAWVKKAIMAMLEIVEEGQALEKASEGLGSDQPTSGKRTGGPATAAPLPSRPASSRASKAPSVRDTWAR